MYLKAYISQHIHTCISHMKQNKLQNSSENSEFMFILAKLSEFIRENTDAVWNTKKISK